MNTWLTTGQMIDQLKLEETAVNQQGDRVRYGTKADLYYIDKHDEEDGKFFICTSFVNRDKWRIIPKFVSFEEAMEALRNGKTVELHGINDRVFRFNAEDKDIFAEFVKEGLDFNDLLDYNWAIV